ncbi:MAG: putative solute-binding protein [Pseudomonadota bacterium]|nr:putative solute-binding protein [Pseudomonadota bacterium]
MHGATRRSLAAIALCSATHVHAANQSICVFDLLGTSGEMFALMRDYAINAKRWGANITLKSYTDERIAAEDFKAGQCDGVFLTGIRGRQFNSFTGSIDALGAVPSNATARTVLQLMARPQLAKDMVQGHYEVAGVLSFGSAYLLMKDRNVDTMAKLAGKKIAVLGHDHAQLRMVQRIGAQPVIADVNNFGMMFNNGQVDVIGAPAMAFNPMELYKGLGTQGAIVRFPVLHVSTNLIIRPDKFPAGYGQKSRVWVASQIPRVMDWVEQMEEAIPEQYWKTIPANDYVGYIRLIREARVELTKDGFYNIKMMKLLKRLRCTQAPNSFECSMTDE